MADKSESKEASPQSAGVSRRNIFHIVSAAAVTAGALAGQTHEHAQTASEQSNGSKGPYQRQTFDDHQWKTVRVLCDLIIPADERSGSATDAGVPEYLDDWIAFRTDQDGNQNLRAQIFGGLMWLDRESSAQFQKDFADASADQQKQILDRVAYPKRAAKEDHPWVVFFDEFRSLTVGGFFSSKMGVKDLPYLGNAAVAEWKGCDPKIWEIVEDRMKNGYKGILEAKPISL